ncbi:MAG TPA: cation:proton antiporter [Mariprofundaceae bacterium]|nr:cation:proton antiporter [Mariprofundaceae bacterium]
MDPILPPLVGMILIILILSLLLRTIGQPNVIAYLIAGVVLGPQGIGLITDHVTLERLGAFGVVMLLFFIGLKMHPRRLATNWRIALLGTLLQISASVALAWAIGWFLDWPLARRLLIGFVISLSSTALVLNFLQGRGELASRAGQNALVVLLMQDLAVIPMLLLIGMFGDDDAGVGELLRQGVGTLLIGGLCLWMFRQEHIHLPWVHRVVGRDRDLQVFAALILCFGLALITAMLSLSSALGAFVAGMLLASAKEIDWVQHSLDPFRVIFVALFFVSIGMLVDMHFLWLHLAQVGLLVAVAFLTNTFINAVVFRLLREPWAESLYAAALLAQIGEFSFVLVAVGYSSAIITFEGYQTAIAVIAVSLLLAPVWIMLIERMARRAPDHKLS